MNKEKDTLQNWLKFLNPEELKANLLRSAMFILFYEILKNTIVDKVQGFYTDEFSFDENGKIKNKPSNEYKTKVLSLYPKSELLACCHWFKQGGAMDQTDIDTLDNIRKQRNAITHEMTSYLSRTDKLIPIDSLIAAIAIMKKIDVWWFREIEAGTNPDLDHEKIDFEGVLSMQTLLLSYMAPMFTGDDEDMRTLYEGFKELANT